MQHKGSAILQPGCFPKVPQLPHPTLCLSWSLLCECPDAHCRFTCPNTFHAYMEYIHILFPRAGFSFSTPAPFSWLGAISLYSCLSHVLTDGSPPHQPDHELLFKIIYLFFACVPRLYPMSKETNRGGNPQSRVTDVLRREQRAEDLEVIHPRVETVPVSRMCPSVTSISVDVGEVTCWYDSYWTVMKSCHWGARLWSPRRRWSESILRPCHSTAQPGLHPASLPALSLWINCVENFGHLEVRTQLCIWAYYSPKDVTVEW